jgi:hypothetical protein
MVMAHSQYLLDAIKATAPPGTDLDAVGTRWAFLVTYAELGPLVDQMMEIPEFAAIISEKEAIDIKEGRAALHLPNGISVLPELMLPKERLD